MSRHQLLSSGITALAMTTALWSLVSPKAEVALANQANGVANIETQSSKVTDTDQAYSEAQRLISEALITQADELDLSELSLTKIPPEVGQLRNLERFLIYGSQLNELPPEVGQLTNLKLLHLAGKQLRSLPSEIGQLTNLETLTRVMARK